MTPSGRAIALIKRYEGCQLASYQDQRGIWTVGYGTTGPTIGRGLLITQAEADYMLQNHVNAVAEAINKLVTVPLESRQFDALCSLVYNIGAGAFQHSSLLNYLNTQQFDKAADEFLKWDHVGGVEIKGLKARRTDERYLFAHG